MAYEFKNLNEVPGQEKPTENTKVVAFENGSPVQIPASEFGGKGFMFELTADDYTVNDSGVFNVTKNYDPLYDVLRSGGLVTVLLPETNPVPFPHYEIIIGWAVVKGEGLTAFCASGNLMFTNGSHHSTT